MTRPVLYVGDRAYSSWSLRGWLAMRKSGLDFEERLVRLDEPGSPAALADASPARTVPVLHVGGDVIWDSLAIAEWAHEQAPAAKLWPDDPRLRTVGRAAAATMHAGFAALRDAAPMNLHRRGRSRDLGAAALADVAALERVWAHTRSFAGEGPFLLGPWSIADVMAAPYATRLRSYAIAVGPATSAYGEAVFADGDFRDWERTACDDPRRLEHVDAF